MKPTLLSIKIEHSIDAYPDYSYLEQDEWKDRLEQYKNGKFYFIGIRAVAEIVTHHETHKKIHRITSGGLWGIESDSGDEYFAEVARDEVEDLVGELITLNVSKRSINRIVKDGKFEIIEA